MPRSSCADGSAMFTIDASRMIISCAAARTTSAHHLPGSGSVLSDGVSAAGTGSLMVSPRGRGRPSETAQNSKPRSDDGTSQGAGSPPVRAHALRPPTQVPRALLLTGDAAEELDTMYPYYRVQEGGWDVDVSSRTMRDVQLVIHEFDPDSDAYVEKNGRKLPVDVPWADVDVARYDALIIPGGRAPEWIRVDGDVRRITEHFF